MDKGTTDAVKLFIAVDTDRDDADCSSVYGTWTGVADAIEVIRNDEIDCLDADDLRDTYPDIDWETRDARSLTMEELGFSVDADADSAYLDLGYRYISIECVAIPAGYAIVKEEESK